MDLKEYIRDHSIINLTKLAAKMYPNNSGAQPYLSAKLNGSRPWTSKDTDKAREAIKELYDITLTLD